MGCGISGSGRGFKWCYEICSYWGKINETIKEEVESC